MTSTTSSTSASTKPKDTKPVPLADCLRDLALLRAYDINLSSLLQTQDDAISTQSPAAEESVKNSYLFAQNARAAIKIHNRGEAESQGERVDDVRKQLEDLLDGLEGGVGNAA